MASPSLTEMALIDLEKQGENMSTEGRALHNGIWNGQGYARMPPYFKIDTRFVYLIENWKATPVDLPIPELTGANLRRENLADRWVIPSCPG